MPDQTAVNSQVTDAVTQTNVKVLGEAPAEALGFVLQSMSNAVGLSLENATQTQGSMQQITTASTSSVVTLILKAAGSS